MKKKIIISGIIIGLCVLLFALAPLGILIGIVPMGTGDDDRIHRYSQDLMACDVIQLKSKYPRSFVEKKYGPECIWSIADDSHGSMWGGNMVLRVNGGDVKIWKMHVCGGIETQYMPYESECKRNNVAPSANGFIEFINKNYFIDGKSTD